jgi:hypothetical protein
MDRFDSFPTNYSSIKERPSVENLLTLPPDNYDKTLFWLYLDLNSGLLAC